jgi:hypothetical protein
MTFLCLPSILDALRVGWICFTCFPRQEHVMPTGSFEYYVVKLYFLFQLQRQLMYSNSCLSPKQLNVRLHIGSSVGIATATAIMNSRHQHQGCCCTLPGWCFTPGMLPGHVFLGTCMAVKYANQHLSELVDRLMRCQSRWMQTAALLHTKPTSSVRC